MENKQADMRCNKLAFCLTVWELMAIISPERIKIDIFELLRVRGGGIFQAHVTPIGRVHLHRDQIGREKYYSAK